MLVKEMAIYLYYRFLNIMELLIEKIKLVKMNF